MKLRYRLFLWVGLIFAATFFISIFLETHLTDRNLTKAELNLRTQILQLNEEKRRNIEDYLQVSLSENQAEVDSLLLRIGHNPELTSSLFLTPKYMEAVWSSTSFLLVTNKWLDFVQTSRDQNPNSVIIPVDLPLKHAQNYPIDEDLSWIVLNQDQTMQNPYLAIRMRFTKLEEKKTNEDVSDLIEEFVENSWNLHVFFKPQDILTLAKKNFANIAAHHLHLSPDYAILIANLKKAADYLSSHSQNLSQWIQGEISRKSKARGPISNDASALMGCVSEKEQQNQHLIRLFEKDNQMIMIASLSGLFHTDLFGGSPFSSLAPVGMARLFDDGKNADVVFTKEVFYPDKLFQDALFYQKHPSSAKCMGLADGIAVIAAPSSDRLFIGNVLKLTTKESPQSVGYLTIGVNSDNLVQQIGVSLSEMVFLVHDNKVYSAFTKEGKKVPQDQIDSVPFTPSMLQQTSGVISWEGESYYFLQMVPFSDLDLHFFILSLEKDAFALVHSIDQGTRQVIDKISFNMRIIAVIALVLVLVLLEVVSRRITKPITALAKVTEDVAAGRLEGIQLPQAPKGRQDEVASLCRSFEQMVKGLKEKEKVKGVLNKVVSQEIAQEILKGSIHLGGEEKKVTVLFADIRNFTAMTEKMDPLEVIDMLNSCMTKISHVIDQFGGVIDKYVGDEVMALFGAPIAKEESALNAILCALKMVDALKEWNDARAQQGKPKVEMGIGIHTGIMLAGNMGAENRLNYTVIGSNVNLAARLCAAAKGMQILISQGTLDEQHVKDKILYEPLLPMSLKGFVETIPVYAVKGLKT